MRHLFQCLSVSILKRYDFVQHASLYDFVQHALKGQKHLAQGIALGNSVVQHCAL